MGSEWPQIKLQDVCDKITKGTTPTTLGYGFSEFGINFIKSECLTYEGVIDSNKFSFINTTTHQAMRRSQIRANDLLMSMAGVYLGKVALVSKVHTPANTNQAVAIIRLKPNVMSHRFVAYCLRSPSIKWKILNNVAQSAQPNINLTDIGNLILPMPTLKEQQAIAHILGSLDEKIELNRQMNRTLESMAQAIFKSWFVDFDPVRAKAEGRDHGLPQPLADFFPARLVDSELGDIPEGWEMIPFGDLLTDSIGGDWGKETPDEIHEEPIAVIRGTDIPDVDSGGVGNVPVRYTTRSKIERRRLEDGDIIIEVSGGSPTQPTGRSLLVSQHILDRFPTDAVCASFCRRFRPINCVAGVFASQHLAWLYHRGGTWVYQNQSTGIANFQTTRFLASELVTQPEEAVLSEYFRLIDPILRRRSLNESLTLAALRDALLPQLISGELRVPDAEKIVGRAI